MTTTADSQPPCWPVEVTAANIKTCVTAAEGPPSWPREQHKPWAACGTAGRDIDGGTDRGSVTRSASRLAAMALVEDRADWLGQFGPARGK